MISPYIIRLRKLFAFTNLNDLTCWKGFKFTDRHNTSAHKFDMARNDFVETINLLAVINETAARIISFDFLLI